MSTGTGQLRQHIPHAHELGLAQLDILLAKDTLVGWFTEKPDGMAFEIGYDLLGFYTRSATSPKIRQPHGYADVLRAKFGNRYNPKFAERFDHLHSLFKHNRNLQVYLRTRGGLATRLSGEIFYRPDAKCVDGMLKFETILYAPFKIGTIGTFVVHSQLRQNQLHNLDEFKSLGNSTLKFDDDVISDRLFIDVSKEKSRLQTIDRVMLRSRKRRNIEARENERKKLEEIARKLSETLRYVSNGLAPKWGYQTEGYVFHPEGHDLRVKIISDLFKVNFDGRKYQNSERTVPVDSEPYNLDQSNADQDPERDTEIPNRVERMF